MCSGGVVHDALVGRAGIVRVGVVVGINVDQLHIEIGVGAGAGDFELGRDGAGDGHVLFQRIGLVDQHVGPVAGEALVVHHVALGHGVGGVADEGHGMVGVAHVFVHAFGFVGRIEAELAAGVEVESLGRGGFGRPGVEAAPDVGSGLEDHRFGLRRALAFQVMLEERELDVGAEVLARSWS